MDSAPKLTAKKSVPESGGAARIDAYVGRDALRKCGGVYVITRQDGLVKVGITAEDFSRRFKEIDQASRSAGIVGLHPEILIPMDEGMAEVESAVHKQLSANREGGEWFRMTAGEAVNAALSAAFRQRRRNAEGRKLVELGAGVKPTQLTAEERLEWARNPSCKDVIAAALEIARRIDDADSRAGALRGIALTQAEAGNMEMALAIARGIDNINYHAGALGDIASTQAKAGDLDGASATVRSIDKADFRALVLRDIALAQAEAGDTQSALHTFTDALSVAQNIDNEDDRAGPLHEIALGTALVLAKAGDLDGAFTTARSIDDEDSRAGALCDIALAQAKAGDKQSARGTFIAALSIARSIGVDRTGYPAWSISLKRREHALSRIAPAQAKAGDLDGAFATARSIDSTHSRAWALSGIALAQAEVGDLDGAFATARSVDNADSRAWALIGIALAQAKAGDAQPARDTFAAALSAAQNVDNADSRAWVLIGIALAQAKAGDAQPARDTFATALSAARNVDNADSRAWVLNGIASAQAEAGDFRKAMKTAMEIEYDNVRADALAGIAKSMATKERN